MFTYQWLRPQGDKDYDIRFVGDRLRLFVRKSTITPGMTQMRYPEDPSNSGGKRRSDHKWKITISMTLTS